MSRRPPNEYPVTRPIPESYVIIARILSSSARCAFTYSNEPIVPCSSPLKSAKRIVRRGKSPVALIGRVTGYSLGGRRDIEAGVREVLKPLESWGANNHTYDASFGTDNFDFMLEGVPTLVANQEEANYLPNRSEERRVGKECRSRWSPY